MLTAFTQPPVWNPEALLASPLFAPLHDLLATLPRHAPPSIDELNRRLDPNRPSPRFAPPPPGAFDYEAYIAASGTVPTRPGNLHDAFNALIWLRFPLSKRALNQRHVAHIEAGFRGNRRGPARDALTQFDESGAIVVSTDPSLSELLRQFRWKALFWQQRQNVIGRLRCYLFGHGLYEKALTPYLGLTAKAIVVDLDGAPARAFLRWDTAAQCDYLDGVLAARLERAAPSSPRQLQPLPLLGIPGWWPNNNRAAFYDNADYFRQGRSRSRPRRD